MVAMFGLIIPDPFATPERLTFTPSTLNETEQYFSTRSVVKMPFATLPNPSSVRELTSLFAFFSIDSTGSN